TLGRVEQSRCAESLVARGLINAPAVARECMAKCRDLGYASGVARNHWHPPVDHLRVLKCAASPVFELEKNGLFSGMRACHRFFVTPSAGVFPAPVQTMYPSVFFWKSLPVPQAPCAAVGSCPQLVMN